jgi:hypothetical protein
MRRLLVIALLGVSAAAAAHVGFRQWGEPHAERDALRLVPAEVDFGSTLVGRPVSSRVIATNAGEQPVLLPRLHAAAPFRASASGVRFAPGVAKEIPVTFDPEEPGEFTGTLVLESKAFDDGVLEVALRGVAIGPPEIALAPRSLAFGEVQIGGTGRALITVSNLGSSVLEVAGQGITSVFHSAPGSLSVEPGGGKTLEVSFSPKREGKQTAMLRLQNNEPGRGDLLVPLEGIGVEHVPLPSIEVSPAALEFGKVPTGGSAERRLTIRNGGESPLTVASFSFQPPFRSAARSRTIAPDRPLSLSVTCWRPPPGTHFALLVISSNDPDQEVVAVALSCEGDPDVVSAQVGVDGGDASRTVVPPGLGGAGGGEGTELAEGAEGELEGTELAEGAEGGLEGTKLAEGEGDAEVAAETPEDAAEGNPDLPGAGLSEGSSVNLASFKQFLSDLSHEGVAFDPASGWLEIRGLQLPVVDSGFSGYWMFTPVNVEGSVSSLGDFSASVPVTFYDRHGVATQLVLDLTTDTAVARVKGVEMAFAGRPLEGNEMRIVGAARIPDGSLAQELLQVTLDVRVE